MTLSRPLSRSVVTFGAAARRHLLPHAHDTGIAVTPELSDQDHTLHRVEPSTDETSAEQPLSAAVSPPFRGSVRAFDYLSIGTSRAPLYRAIVGVFLERREVFDFTLSTDDVWGQLQEPRTNYGLLNAAQLEVVLAELAERGNLHKSQSTAAAATIADLRERRSLWRLTEAGFVAERAAREVEAVFERTGALRRTALAALRLQLEGDLTRYLAADAIDATDQALLAVLFTEIFAKTEDLRASAQTFMTTLDTHLARPELTLAAFADVRDAIFGHVETFLGELARSGPAIGRAVASAEPAALARLLDVAAAVEPEPTFDGSDPISRTRARLEGKWHGLERWFCGTAGESPTYEFLKARAEESIGTLIRLLRRLHEARSRPLTKPRDFITLARWFEATRSLAEANRVWHAAFGLSPARHFGYPIDADDAAWSAPVSWWDAPPVAIPPRLRLHGQMPSGAGQPGVLENLTANLAAMQARADAQSKGELDATRRFVDRGPLRLSTLGELDELEFAVLRSWLGRAFRARRSGGASILIESLDGRYLVEVRPADEAGRLVGVTTPHGIFEAPDHILEVTTVGAGASSARASA